MGYQGIVNSLAVEFDTYYNPELIEPYENHISVQTRGWRYPNSANESFSLASSVAVPDLTDGEHTVKIEYVPVFDESALFQGNFQMSPYVAHFLENADAPNGAQPDWGTGMGMMKV